MLQAGESRFPSFWQLQMLGWGGFYLLVLAPSFSSLKASGGLVLAVVNVAIFVFSLFLASLALRGICRSLSRRSLPWLTLEARALAWSLLFGAAAALVMNLVAWIFQKFDWTEWMIDFVESTVVLFLWCSLYFSIKQWQQATDERERLLRAESEARQARLNTLRYQLNPHFLFNSLNAVSTLILEGNAPAATRMLSQIGDLLRTTLASEASQEISLAQEIAFTERYLAIEQTRLGDRLRAKLATAPDTLDALVPNMLLQPLVENAVRHGIAPLAGGGSLLIQSIRSGAQLRIVVRNSGVQMTKPPAARGVGLNNTAERLRTLYGDEHQFTLEWPEEGGCQVAVEIPFRRCAQRQEVLVCAH